MICVFGGEKGGTGKTSFATNFAVCLSLCGFRIMLYDADPQRSAIEWARARAALGLPTLPNVYFAEGDKDGITAHLERARKKYDHVVVDVGGAHSAELVLALRSADCLCSPFIPSAIDLKTAAKIDSLVGDARQVNPALRAFVFLNKTMPKPDEDEEALEARDELAPFTNLVVARSAVVARKPFRRAFKFHITVPEVMRSKDRAARKAAQLADDELWSLYQEVTGYERAA